MSGSAVGQQAKEGVGLLLSLPVAPFAPPPPPPPRDGVGAGRGKSAEPSSVHPHAGAAFPPLPGNAPASLSFFCWLLAAPPVTVHPCQSLSASPALQMPPGGGEPSAQAAPF